MATEKTKRELVIEQLSLMDEIVGQANVNIVTCGHCGTVNLHKVKPISANPQLITCYECKHELDVCDCPDLFYTGMENSALYEENNPAESKRKFYQTVYQVEVLSKEKFDESGGMSLTDIDEAISSGDCSGRIKTIVDNEVKTGKEIAVLLKEQGSDPDFFQLDENGNDLED